MNNYNLSDDSPLEVELGGQKLILSDDNGTMCLSLKMPTGDTEFDYKVQHNPALTSSLIDVSTNGITKKKLRIKAG